MMNYKKIAYVLLTIPMSSYAALDGEMAKTIGNFATPRKLVTNFGLGQNLVAKGSVILYEQFTQEKSCNSNILALSPYLLYAPEDYVSFYITIPIFVKMDVTNSTSSREHGVGDFVFQGEGALYTHNTPTRRDQITFVANIGFPTGFVTVVDSQARKPSTGYGAVSYFFGATASRLTPRWYYYISDGGTITTDPGRDKPKIGNTLYYQAGFGFNFGNPWGSALAATIECNGLLIGQNSTNGVYHPNTGGNIIFLGPSLFFSKNRWTVLAGIQLPVLQHLNGTQDPQIFRTSINASVKF